MFASTERVLSHQGAAAEDGHTHRVVFGAVLMGLRAAFPEPRSVLQPQGSAGPGHKPNGYGSLIRLDSAFSLADFSDSFLQFSAFCC